jgi:ion channel POLLUX/CASTOR
LGFYLVFILLKAFGNLYRKTKSLKEVSLKLMTKITFKQRLRYWFDNSLSRGTASLITWLAVITFAMVLTVATILFFTKLVPDSGEAPAAAEETSDSGKSAEKSNAKDVDSDKTDAKHVADKKDESISKDGSKSKEAFDSKSPKTLADSETKTETKEKSTEKAGGKAVDDKDKDSKSLAAEDKLKEPVIVEKTNEPEGYSFPEALWQSLMHSMDAGTVAGDNGWSYRFVMLLVTLGGIFIMGSLISILSSGLEAKLEELRKGRSFVCEENHTLILGWSSRIFLIISELAIANENAVKPRVVILSDKDKVEMEDEIRDKVGDTGKTKVVCRSGSPIDLTDLEIVNPHSTKSIIILSPENSDDPDSQVIKMILAITNNPNRRSDKYHIVAELQNSKNLDIAKMVGKDEVELILTEELISRITVQTSRQTGLSIVYKDLLDFGGDEIYYKNEPSLAGKTYGEALSLFQDSSVIGLQKKGVTTVNPDNNVLIDSADNIVIIASDDSNIRISGNANPDSSKIVHGKATAGVAERNLILGWNTKGEIIVREMDHYVPKGSELTVVSQFAETEVAVNVLASEMENMTVSFILGDTTDRKLLDSMNLPNYQHIILLCYADDLEMQDADSKTLMTLLHLRDIESHQGESYSVVSEMLDIKNRALAEIAKADDFIVSDELAGLLLTQVSENKQLGVVFEDLFDADGSEIYLKAAIDYVSIGESTNFYTVVESARQRNETAIGYRILSEVNDSSKAFGIHLNPLKSDSIKLTAEDKVIVVSES